MKIMFFIDKRNFYASKKHFIYEIFLKIGFVDHLINAMKFLKFKFDIFVEIGITAIFTSMPSILITPFHYYTTLKKKT